MAVVGVGGFGQFSIEAYRRTDDISVRTIVDPISADPVPGIRWERDLAPVLEDASIEAVHLATPPYLRGELAVPVLLAGKSVFCEKPLALSLAEADTMLEASARSGSALGVDYVMRHHRAFALVEALASSHLLGDLKSFSLQNFAQSLPQHHWMWDRTRSGGIFVEHGVHFFDAYGRIAGAPLRLWASAPRREAVEVTIQYQGSVVGRYYHEFAFPKAVERTVGTIFFDRGYVEIDGWIPTRLHGAVLAESDALEAVGRRCGIDVCTESGDATRFEARFTHRNHRYADAVVGGMRDVLARHRDGRHQMLVRPEDARHSLEVALLAQRSTDLGTAMKFPVSADTTEQS